MKKHTLIADAHALANTHLERLAILLLLLPRGREIMPPNQRDEADVWMFEMVDRAQDAIQSAADALANLKEEAK